MSGEKTTIANAATRRAFACPGHTETNMLFGQVRIFRQLGVSMLLAMLLSPGMTCLVPGARMNIQERACCRRMGPECGQPGMQMTRSCCQGSQRILDNQVVTTSSGAVPPFTSTALPLSLWTPPDSHSSTASHAGSLDTSLSGSPPISASVLRI